MEFRTYRVILGRLLLLILIMSGCRQPHDDLGADGRIHIDYWEKWGGFERQAMQDMVDEFNASQDRIYVNFLSVSQIDRKLILATAGGIPPDISGLESNKIASFVENGALTPLDRYAAEYGIGESDYLPSVWKEVVLYGKLWGLPTTPGAMALHWNKQMFREAGLDPERPPRTIAELEAFNDQITRFDENGHIEVMGHLPTEPGWWKDVWGIWFGGTLWNGKDTITATAPGNLASMEWVASYPQRFGAKKIINFQDVSGNFASPQNPFFNARVAMVLQGPWMYNFIKNFAPEDFEWGVAPFPGLDESYLGTTIIECNTLVIPKGARHPDEAFEFIAWMQRPENLEKLNLKHQKFSPLTATSEAFYQQHPNPNIRVYRELAESPLATGRPRLSTFPDYDNDMDSAVDEVLRGTAEPEAALAKAQERQEKLFQRAYRRWQKVKATRMEEWEEQ